jgi:hypothetical protein
LPGCEPLHTPTGASITRGLEPHLRASSFELVHPRQDLRQLARTAWQ